MIRIRFLLLACLYFSLNIQAQESLPDTPILQRVSVDPLVDDGFVTIEWTVENPPKSTMETHKFVIYWFDPDGPTYHPIDTVPKHDVGSYTYTFFYEDIAPTNPTMPDPRETTVPFMVAAIHLKPNGEVISSLQSYIDWNIQVSNKYDSCRAEIKLYWHPYKGWQANTPPGEPLVNYRVMRIHGGGIPDEEVKVLSDLDTVFVVRPVNENETYTFYIEAMQRNRMMISTSFRTTKTTTMPRQPSFIEALGTQYNSDGVAEISFLIDPNSETYSYELLGSSKPDYAFVSLGTFNIHGDTVLTDIRARETPYYYRLEAWHVCRNKYTATSNMATALWLTMKQDDQVNYLIWNPYKDWGTVARYEVHRQVGNNPDKVIATTTDTDPSPTKCRDDLSGVLIDGDVCYWITAVPNPSTSSGQIAISNKICIIPESDIFIPQAFIPTIDGTITENSEYKVFFSYPPQEFVFYIYDRIGANVFQTNIVSSDGISAGWDGRLKNGKPANEGVYVYYLRYRTAKGRLVEKKGTLILVRP